MKPSVAPTIFMMAISSRRSNVVSLMVLLMMNTDTSSSMAISSRRSKVVSLMVLEMMNTEMISRMAIRAMLMTLAMLRTVMKPLEMSWSARTLAMPSVSSSCCTTWSMSFRSVRCIT